MELVRQFRAELQHGKKELKLKRSWGANFQLKQWKEPLRRLPLFASGRFALPIPPNAALNSFRGLLGQLS